MLHLNNHSKRLKLVSAAALLLALSLPACTGTRMEALPASQTEIAQQLEVGDYVRIWTTDGAWRELEVSQVTATTISGSGEEVSLSSIDRIDVRRFDGWDSARRTGSAVGGAVIGVVVFALLVIAG